MRKKTLPILAITLLAIAGCSSDIKESSSASASSSLTISESSEEVFEPYNPECGFAKGYRLFDRELGYGFKNIEEFKGQNIIFENSSITVKIVIGNNPVVLYAGDFLYASDVNCDGYLDLIYGTHHVEGLSGDYYLTNKLYIFDIHNEKTIFTAGSGKNPYRPYLEKDQQMAISISCENAAGNLAKEYTAKFKLNDKEDMTMIKTPEPFKLNGIAIRGFKDITDDLARPVFSYYFSDVSGRTPVNTYDTFEFRVSLDYEGSLSLNDQINSDLVTFAGDHIKEYAFSRYEDGHLYYNISFAKAVDEPLGSSIKATLLEHETTRNIWIDDSLTYWSKNRHTLRDIGDYRIVRGPSLNRTISVIYEEYPYTNKKRVRAIESKHLEDMTSLLDVYDAPIEYVSNFNNPNGAYTKITFVDDSGFSSNNTVIKFDNGTYLYGQDIHYAVDYTPNFIIETEYYWHLAETKYATAFSVNGTERARSFDTMDTLRFYDWPENVPHPTNQARFVIEEENQEIYIYDKNSVKIDDEWFYIKGNFFNVLFNN